MSAASPYTSRVAYSGLSLDRLGAFSLYLAVFVSFFGSAFLSIEIGGIHIFPYRVLLIWIALIFFWGLCLGTPLLFDNVYLAKNYLFFMVLWLVYSICHVFLVQDFVAYLKYSLFLVMGIMIIFFTIYYIQTISQLNWLYRIWLLVLLILVAIGLVESFTGYHLEVSKHSLQEMESIRYIPTGTFKMTNHYATCLAMSMPLVLSLFSFARKWWIVIFSLSLIGSMSYLILQTQSRLNLMTVLLQLVVAYVFFFSKKRRWGLIGVIMICCLGAYLIFPGKIQSGLVNFKRQFVSAYNQVFDLKGSGKIRVNLALNGILFLRDSAGLGVGAGNFNTYMEQKPYFPTKCSYHPQNILFPHNWWIELLSEYGILIFTLYLVFFVMLFKKVVQVYKQASQDMEKKLGQALILGLVGFLISCTGPGYFIAFRPQWLLLAMCLTYISLGRGERRET